MQPLPKSPLSITCLIAFAWGNPVVAELPENLGSWSPVVRESATGRAAKAGPGALPELFAALSSDNSGLRHSATKSIAIIARQPGSKDTREWQAVSAKLIAMLNGDPDFWVRCGAASALKVIRPPAAVPALVKAAADPDPWVAAAAVDAISGFPVKLFDPKDYLATAVRSLQAPRSETRGSAIKMLGGLGDEGKKAMPEVVASIGTYSQDSMFADRPRIDAIIWISRFDRKKAAALAGGVLLEERWGTSGRYRRLLPFLDSLGADAAPAKEALRAVAATTAAKDKASADKARKILTKIK